MITLFKLFDFTINQERALRPSDVVELGSNLQIGGNLILNVDNVTADLESSSVSFHRGTSTPHAKIEWNYSSDRFDFNFPISLMGTQKSIYFTGAGSLESSSTLSFKDSFLTSAIPLSETGTTGLNIGFTATSIIGAINELYSTPASVSFEALDAMGDVGTGSDQVAVGDHTHAWFPYQVTTYLYVDSNRTDIYTESGNIGAPYKSLQGAIDAAGDGTAILLAPGVYSSVVIPNTKSISMKAMGQGKSLITIVEGLTLSNSLVDKYFLAEDIRFFKAVAPPSPLVSLGQNWNVHFERCEVINQGTGKSLIANNVDTLFSGGCIQGTVDLNLDGNIVFDDDVNIERNSGDNKFNILSPLTFCFFRGTVCYLQIMKSGGVLTVSTSVLGNGGLDLPLIVNTAGDVVVNDLIVDQDTQTAIYAGSGYFWVSNGPTSRIFVGTHSILDGIIPYKHISNAYSLNGGMVTNLPYPLKASDVENDTGGLVFGETVREALINLKLKVTYVTLSASDESNGYVIITPAASGPDGVKDNVEVTVLDGPQHHRGRDFTAANSDLNDKLVVIWRTSGFTHPEFSTFTHPSDGLVGKLTENDIISIQYQ